MIFIYLAPLKLFKMNKIKFGDEHLALGKWMRGVYKLTFNDKWFYIGSSVDLKRRMSGWKTRLTQTGFSKNGSIKFILPEIVKVNFKVLEIVPDGRSVKEVEDVYLKKFIDNEFCLNLTPDAFNGKGRKRHLGKPPKVEKVKGEISKPKPVAQFDVNGKLVKKHKSIGAAARWLEIKPEGISEHLRGIGRKTVKGFVFKLIDENGRYIEHEIYKNKMPIGRKFFQIDKNGKVVAEYHNLITAAKALGFPSLTKNISRVLNGEYRYKSCKGYVFRYADNEIEP